MITSMTGFGRGTGADAEGTIEVEIRSINSRFLDVTVRGGVEAALLETRVRDLLRGGIERGKISVNLTLGGGNDRWLRPDLDRAAACVEALTRLRDTLQLRGEPDLGMVASFREIFRPAEDAPDEAAAWQRVQPVFQQAIEALMAMRRREGEALARDLLARLQTIEGALQTVEARAPERIPLYLERLRARVTELAGEITVDPDRLAQELVLYADRIDISEEETRLKSHLDQARSAIADQQPAGRRLGFLLQEMHREVNTIGSKANDAEISRAVVIMKEELERIREQVQNIE